MPSAGDVLKGFISLVTTLAGRLYVRYAVRRSAQAAARRVRQVPARRRPVTRDPAPALGAAARASCARVLVRAGTDENTGEALSAAAVAERVGWCAALVQGMAARLTAAHWNPAALESLVSGHDAAGRPLPAMAWMALRRLGWGAAPPDGITVNDRIARMAQEQAGRILRSARWRDGLTRAVTGTWPADPARRTGEEWDAVRAAVPGGEHLPSAVIRARTRQAARYLRDEGRLPADVTELEAPPRVPGTLILAACDRQQAGLGRHETDSRRALLRVQLPLRPDPRGYKDWTWVAVPLNLPPTVPAGAVLHLPTLRIARGQVTERLRHIAAEHGIAVVTVPPKGTSKNCPRCLAPLRHCKAPDRPAVPGWKWARCPSCGWQGDRDTGAWQRIAARGLAHQARTAVNRDNGTMAVRAVHDDLEARAVVTPYASGRDRSKTGPTPRRTAPRRAPRRRAAPSPPRPSGHGGQRPEGHATPARTPLPRAATRDQRVSTTCTAPARRPHRARGGGTRRRLPPARPRHPAQTGTRPPARSRKHGIAEDHQADQRR